VEEAAVVRSEVVAVADQPVLGRLADPGEVLELVRGEHSVGTGEGAPLREQGGEHDEREAGECDQQGQLEAVETEWHTPARRPVRRPCRAA
jgi:hypothetical protein